jgi:hypothetical protein
MIEQLIIGLLFVAALIWLGWRVLKTMSPKEAGCGKGCGCAADTKPVRRAVS